MKFSQPVPELPVANLEKAQNYYKDVLGFNIKWCIPGEIGAVSSGETAIFFRQRADSFEPAVHWIFAANVDSAYKAPKNSGATIVEAIQDKPWGQRQFTIKDLDGNIFYIHHDL